MTGMWQQYTRYWPEPSGLEDTRTSSGTLVRQNRMHSESRYTSWQPFPWANIQMSIWTLLTWESMIRVLSRTIPSNSSRRAWQRRHTTTSSTMSTTRRHRWLTVSSSLGSFPSWILLLLLLQRRYTRELGTCYTETRESPRFSQPSQNHQER